VGHDNYSIIHHLCWGILLNHDPASTWIAIMTEYAAYFDDSGHPDDQEAVVVAGFIASERDWLLFEREWQEILDKDGIELFHMADFEKNKVWPQYKKDAILRRLVNAIKIRTVKSISQCVLMDAYRKINERYAFEESVGAPYALAGRTVAKSLNDWKKDFAEPGDKLLVFFEDGTKHKGEFMDAMQRDGLPCPVFLKKPEATPLQAADLLAWEMFNAFKTRDIRPSLKKMLGSLPLESPDHGYFDVSTLERICKHKDAKVPLRSSLAPGTVIVHHNSPKRHRRRTIFEKRK
jgi:hypothetical protein